MSAFRPVWVDVDLDAVRENVATLAGISAPASVLVVVKADGYGHGALPIARAAVEAGAAWLGVALVEEGVALRAAGLDAPILVLSEPPAGAADAVVEHELTPVVYTPGGVGAVAEAVRRATAPPRPVHLKVDTGMHRVGCAPEAAPGLTEKIRAQRELVLEGLLTHLAVADEPGNPATGEQLARFDEVLAAVDPHREVPLVHAANSAGALVVPESRRDLVRVGIAAYGIDPAPALAGAAPLRPALSLRARVSFVKDVPAGSRVSYGLHHTTATPTRLATVPVGYADGVPRNLGRSGGAALVHGRRRPIAGAVTMDQLVLDCGPGAGDAGSPPVEAGDEVVLIGRQGDDEVTATEWAERLGTIGYEIVCGIGPRVPRRYRG